MTRDEREHYAALVRSVDFSVECSLHTMRVAFAVGAKQVVYEKEVLPCGEQLNCLLFCR